MSSSKKIDLLLRDFAAGVYLYVPPPPPNTLYPCTQYEYTYSHREGGGGIEPERKLEGQQYTKLGRKYQHD